MYNCHMYGCRARSPADQSGACDALSGLAHLQASGAICNRAAAGARQRLASFYDIAAEPISDSPSKGICDRRCTACCQLSPSARWDSCHCRSSGGWAPLQ